MGVNNSFKRISWEKAVKQLSPVLNEYTETARLRVLKGLEHIYSINVDSICLLRAERFELVVVGFNGPWLLSESAKLISEMAKLKGFTSIRVHTKRKGECRFLNKLGLPFRIIERRPDSELVLIMEL